MEKKIQLLVSLLILILLNVKVFAGFQGTVIEGTEGDDELYGGVGNDEIYGYGGGDAL